MKVINASVIVFPTVQTDPYMLIERVGRICYKSENLITETSAGKFVEAMYKSNHHAMLEHYHVMISMTNESFKDFISTITQASMSNHINLSKYINVTSKPITKTYFINLVSGSFRAFIDILKYIGDNSIGRALGRLLYMSYPVLFPEFSYALSQYDSDDIELLSWDKFNEIILTEELLSDEEKSKIISHHTPITAIFTCDRGVSHELVRHRPAGFAQESTRYCNYSNDKFGNEITFIKPCFWEEDSTQMKLWEKACEAAEITYFTMLISGAEPQQARSVLPNSTKTDIALTATEEEWQHIINLRYHGTTGKPHPQMLEVMEQAYPELCETSFYRLK